MERDLTKFFLFIALSLAVLILVTNRGSRPLAFAPLSGDNPIGESETAASDITRGAGFANAPTAQAVPPLNLMMPDLGTQGSC